MTLRRWPIVMPVAAVIAVAATLAIGSWGSLGAAAGGPQGIGGGTLASVRYLSAPGNISPSRRDVTRRTAVFPGVAEITVLRVYVTDTDSSRRVVVDTSILSMRHSPVVPSHEVRFELRDANGRALGGLVVSRSLDQALLGGDDRRYQLSWNGPTTSSAEFVITSATSVDQAAFAIALQAQP